MFNIVLVNPEIPPNTGNIVRTCSATGASLHLVKPLGFDTDDKSLKRAGLDYWSEANIVYWESLDDFLLFARDKKLYFLSTKAKRCYSDVKFDKGDFLVFGRETKGLSEDLLKANYENTIRIPMQANSRSLNLSNSVAIVLYEALRQNNFQELNLTGNLSK